MPDIKLSSSQCITGALAVSVFLVQVESELYLLALSLALILTAFWISLNCIREDGRTALSVSLHQASIGAACLIAIFLSSTAFSVMPTVSWWFAWILAAQPLAYIGWNHASKQGEKWAPLFRNVCIILALLGLWAAGEFLATATRVNGPFQDWNAFGALMYLLALPTLAKAAATPPKETAARAGIWALTTIGCLAAFASASRGATAVLIACSALILFAARRAGTLNALFLAKMFAVYAGSYAFVKLYPDSVSFRTLALSTDASTLGRILMWKSAWTAYLDFPWTGSGLSTYKLQYLHYRLPEEIFTSGDLAHNDYLQLLMEGGPLTLGAFAAWTCFAAWVNIRLWLRSGDNRLSRQARATAVESLGLSIAAFGLFAHATINFIFYILPLSILAGIYLAQAHQTIGTTQLRTIRLSTRPWALRTAATFGGVLLIGGLLVDWMTAKIFASQTQWSIASEIRAEPARRFELANLIASIRPNHVPALQAAAESAMDMALAEGDEQRRIMWARMSLQNTKQWSRASGGSPFVYLMAGQLLWRFPQIQREMEPEFTAHPEALFAKSIDRNHADPAGYITLAQFQETQGRDDDALRTLHGALPWLGIPIADPATGKSWEKLIAEGRRLAKKKELSERTSDMKAIASDFLAVESLSVEFGAIQPSSH